MGMDEHRRPDLGAFVEPMRQVVDDDIVVCATPTTTPNNDCTTLLATTPSDDAYSAFFLYEEDTSEFIGSIGIVLPLFSRTDHTECEPKPRAELTNDSCRRDASVSLDALTHGFLDGATRFKVQNKETGLEETERSTRCVGVNTGWVEHDHGPNAGERVYFHSRVSKRIYDTHTDQMILFTLTMYSDDSGDERAFLEHTTDEFHDEMLRLDLATRGTYTYQIEERPPPSKPERDEAPPRPR